MDKRQEIAQFSKCISKSQILARGRIVIHSVILVATSGGTADVTIYDGDNTSGEKKMRLKASADTVNAVAFPIGFLLNQAMFVSIGSNVDCVCISWSHVESG